MINNNFNNNIYSTDEVIVGQQIDGKPIYRKVFEGSYTLGKDDQANITLSPNPNVDQIINAVGYIYSQDPNKNEYQAVKVNIDLIATKDRANGIFETIANESRTVTYIVLEYTKTTDTTS